MGPTQTGGLQGLLIELLEAEEAVFLGVGRTYISREGLEAVQIVGGTQGPFRVERTPKIG